MIGKNYKGCRNERSALISRENIPRPSRKCIHYKHFVHSSRKWYITKDVTFYEEHAYFSEHPPQGESRCNDEEYSCI